MPGKITNSAPMTSTTKEGDQQYIAGYTRQVAAELLKYFVQYLTFKADCI